MQYMDGNIKFDNNDKRIKYFELLLERDLDEIPTAVLPEGYHFVFYKDGDMDSWIDIEKSAKEFASYSQGSRFEKEGALIDNPAKRGLNKKRQD